MKYFSVIFVIVLLVILGQYKPKIAIAVSALILFGAILLNEKAYEKILKGDFS